QEDRRRDGDGQGTGVPHGVPPSDGEVSGGSMLRDDGKSKPKSGVSRWQARFGRYGGFDVPQHMG
ncbi:MAG: hypothetical protein M3O88_09515, partial [Actinomycetota bacterium]|nr:hypothetical protein [Actinomycetota bacterium]